MTESTFPLLGAGDGPEAEEQAATGRRRTLLGLGALALAAVTAGVLVLTGGSGEDELAVAAPVSAPTAPAATVAPSPVASAASAPAVDGAPGRDPFQALHLPARATAPASAAAAPVAVRPAAAPAQPPAAAPPPAPAPAPIAGPVAGPIAGVPAAPAAPRPATGPTTAPGPRSSVLVLTRVQGSGDALAAVFTVDGTSEVAAVGASFGPADDLLLLSLQQGPAEGQWTAVVQVGQGDPFDVVSGQRVRLPPV